MRGGVSCSRLPDRWPEGSLDVSRAAAKASISQAGPKDGEELTPPVVNRLAFALDQGHSFKRWLQKGDWVRVVQALGA